jgi:hypothetical protein
MSNFLIIEDFLTDIKNVRNALIANIDKVGTENIFPNLNRTTKKWDTYPFLKENFPDEDFNLIVNDFQVMKILYIKMKNLESAEQDRTSIFEFINLVFSDIDYYIIDKELVSQNNDIYGIEFFKYCQSIEKINSYNYAIITPHDNAKLGVSIPNTRYFKKDKYNGYAKVVAEYFKKLVK